MLQAAEAVLRARGVPAKLEFTRLTAHAEEDARLRIGHGRAAMRYAVEVARGLTPGTLGGVLLKLRERGGKGLIVADYVTPVLADTLRERGIAFVDLAGNAWVQQAGIVLQVTGRRPARPADNARPARVLQPGGLRIVFALLCRPELVNAPVREIAEAAGVAHGTVGWVLRDLKKMGHVVELGRRPGARGRARTRRLEQQRRLLELWVQAYPGQLRPRLNPRRFRATQPFWWRTADFARYGLALGGEPAAERLTQHLKPELVTLYAVGGGERLVHQDHILLNDANGDVEILDAFWNFAPPGEFRGIVPPLLVYADLLATGDDRCIEAARLVYGRYLAQPDGKD
ncbi:MAG: type IV toxin-antitoxin system AbiEi family antitoxin [Burkholderiales bacterium]